MLGKYYPYRPNLQGTFLERFQETAFFLTQTADITTAIENISLQEYNWATNEAKVNPRQRKIYRAVWVLLRDLLRVGWTCRWYEQNLEISPPIEAALSASSDLGQIKSSMRNIMFEPRVQKLLDSFEYIERMENESTSGKLPITALIADGRALARDLREIKSLETNKEDKLSKLRNAVKPYLQLVREGEICEFTGQRLNDIWRYFRYTWATPYESTPGRTMQYIIRDAARPNHPVMGIASLENAPIIINDRDEYIGWTLNEFIDRINQHEEIRAITDAFSLLLTHLDRTIQDINITDLCTTEECENPTSSVIQRLITIAARTELERGIALREWDEKGDDPEDAIIEKSELGNISKAAEEALYKRKRAEQLAKLLSAKKELSNLLNDNDFPEAWRNFIESDSGQTAIKSALVAQKSRHIGTSIMELNVCGAIPPYNEILGGKLAALVMLSKEVVDDYRERYGNRPSDIASRLKGEPVIRQADLVYIGTTSLYKVGSSQYNRLKLPEGMLRTNAPEIKWKFIGETKGFGTMHISRLTLQCLEDALPIQDRGSINRVFGEGASPKLRTIRSGLEKIFEPGQREFLELIPKHSMARLIYGAWLIDNGTEYLCGEETTPNYYFKSDLNRKAATEAIVDYWRERWLLSRLNHEDSLNKIETFDPQTLLLSRDMKAMKDNYAEIEVSDMAEVTCTSSESLREYLRHLYRGSSAYADRINLDNLKAIHVETSLDKAMLSSMRSGKSVVLTGNPGDGKTHLIRILEPGLEFIQPSPLVEYDASRIPDEDLYNQWVSAVEQGRPFCVAINEAVLINLANRYPNFAPLQEARQQVTQAVSYNERVEQDFSVIVFDLSHRNVLSQSVVSAVLNKLADPEIITRCENCPEEGCDFVRNQKLLKNQQVRDRLQVIFDRVSRRGYHATLRELQAFISFLLFAGRNCGEMLETSGEDKYTLHQLIFSGVGNLFDVVRSTFDPSKISHPLWDDSLVYGEADISDWIHDGVMEIGALDPSNESRFISRKRAFFFYNQNGMDLINLAGDDETEFGLFLQMQDRQALRYIIQRINRFFGDDTGSEQLKVWQSHRYNQSPRRILYSALTRKRQEFEIMPPKLLNTMSGAFELAQDHVLLRLKDRHQARLKIDFAMFELLARANRGVPVMSLEGDATRRIWQFMEQLSERLDLEDNPEILITIFDTVTHQKLNAVADLELKKYLTIDSDTRS